MNKLPYHPPWVERERERNKKQLEEELIEDGSITLVVDHGGERRRERGKGGPRQRERERENKPM